MPFTWILDAGHGINTPGKRSPVFDFGQLFEYEFNRDIVDMISDGLYDFGVDHHILVPEIHDVSLRQRVHRCNNLRTKHDKVLVSVHGNGASSSRASGFEVFTTPGTTRSDKVASVFIKELEKEFPGHKHRKDFTDGDADKEANFYIIKKTTCPAILTENEFFTNPEMCKLMLTQKFRRRVADAHVTSILKIEQMDLTL